MDIVYQQSGNGNLQLRPIKTLNILEVTMLMKWLGQGKTAINKRTL
jgi:hypothetical protein